MRLTTKRAKAMGLPDQNIDGEATGRRQERRGDTIVLSGEGASAPPHALTVILPILPPSTNHLYKAVPRRRSKAKGGGVYMGRELSDQAVAFQKLAVCEARVTANMTGWQLPDGPLKLTILITFGSNHRQDVGNREKAATDSLALALGFDDSRVEELHIRKVGVDPKRPLCELILEALR